MGIEVSLDTKVEVAPVREYPAGKNELKPVPIPPEANSARIFFTRENWPDLGKWTEKEMDPETGFAVDPNTGEKKVSGDDKNVVEVRHMVSRDGGATWVMEGAATYAGRHIDRFGRGARECHFNPGILLGAEDGNLISKVEIHTYEEAGALATTVSLKPEFQVPKVSADIQLTSEQTSEAGDTITIDLPAKDVIAQAEGVKANLSALADYLSKFPNTPAAVEALTDIESKMAELDSVILAQQKRGEASGLEASSAEAIPE